MREWMAGSSHHWSKIQTHERFKRTLFGRIKHNMRIFGVIPLVNRRFPEITGEIIRKSEAPALGHHFKHRLLAYISWMISEWRRQSKSAGPWQYQTFRHGPILYWTARWRYALETLSSSSSSSSFRVLRSFWRGHIRCVRLEWRTDWIDCQRSSFVPCSWLKRRNVNKNHR